MPITVSAHLDYETVQSCDLLLQIEAAQDDSQRCTQSSFTTTPEIGSRTIAGEDGIGTRRWLTAGPKFLCDYTATFSVDRPATQISQLVAGKVAETPDAFTKYLMPSRYCHPEAFFALLGTRFGTLSGGALVDAVSHWITDTFAYDISASHAGTTATESLASCSGVCRDYAHVLIAILRAAGIPARYISAYAPDVHPQDFHAVAEVYLEGQWHLIDPTGMAQPKEIIRIGVGRDAADVSFMTSYGAMSLKKQTVKVTRADAT